MPGSTKKKCKRCQATIGVASKTCKVCGEAQPYKALQKKKLEKAKEKMRNSPHRLKANAVKCKDAAHLHLHKLRAVGYCPVLLLGKKKGSKMDVEVLTSLDNTSMQKCMALKDVPDELENVFKGYLDGANITDTDSAFSSSTLIPSASTQLLPNQPSTTSFSCTLPISTSSTDSIHKSTSTVSTNPASTSDLLLYIPTTSSIPNKTGQEKSPLLGVASQTVSQDYDNSVAIVPFVPMVHDTDTALDFQQMVHSSSSENPCSGKKQSHLLTPQEVAKSTPPRERKRAPAYMMKPQHKQETPLEKKNEISKKQNQQPERFSEKDESHCESQSQILEEVFMEPPAEDQVPVQSPFIFDYPNSTLLSALPNHQVPISPPHTRDSPILDLDLDVNMRNVLMDEGDDAMLQHMPVMFDSTSLDIQDILNMTMNDLSTTALVTDGRDLTVNNVPSADTQ
ncbi:uncharacterized protein [Hoplias malabaricus]|uniref:uncharacterized protein n=1 Tax=Hoplias malabaricus TaxID=27720 RepID=UPI003461AC87